MINILNKKNTINYFNKNKSNFFLAILFVFIINILLKSEILYEFIWSAHVLFADYKMNIDWLKGNYLGYDVFQWNYLGLDVPQNSADHPLRYGPIFLLIPFNLKLEIFYLNFLPYIIITLLLFSVTFLISPKNKIGYIVLFLSIFNPSTLLLIERMNFDIFIFLITIFIIFNRFYFINWISIFFLSLTKLYPVALGINIILENKNRKFLMLMIIILSISLLSIFYIYLNFEKYQAIFEWTGAKAGYHFLFSLKTIPKIMKYLFQWNYIFLIIIFLILFALLTSYFYKHIEKNNLVNLIDIYSSETRLFLLGSYILLFCYLIFSNWFFREIFLIILFPLLLQLYNTKSINFLTFFIYLIIFRYIFLFIYGYINVHDNITHINDVRYFSNEFLFVITIKGIIDIFLMSFIGSILFSISKKFIAMYQIIDRK